MKAFDIIIIGGGPIGMACALEAKKKKLKYVIIEKGCLVNSLQLPGKYDFLFNFRTAGNWRCAFCEQ
jgi:thioredoxin reductase